MSKPREFKFKRRRNDQKPHRIPRKKEIEVIEIKDPIKSWWSGDSRVEPYMPEINQALDRNKITGDARTDIYNRAYEAVYAAIKDFSKEQDK